jgi:RND family efflux transporter MFP subunit
VTPARDSTLPDAPREAAHERHSTKDEIGFELPKPASVSRGRAVLAAAAVAFVLGGAFFFAFLPNRRSRTALSDAAHTEHAALPRVDVVTPKEAGTSRTLRLPATIRPLEETVLYSRADGFVADWKVDIGDKVKADQVLAVLETPELDQQILQAKAQLAQAEASTKQAAANRDFSRSTLDRYKRLAAEGLSTQQDLDEKAAQAQVNLANVDVAAANVGTQKANLARLYKLKSFASVTAPFAGTVTARTVERGALVVAGNSAPLFKIAATDPVRVFVDVPQDMAPSVKIGEPASITVREFPGKVFEGRIARSTGALDQTTRTLSTEIRVPNPDGVLLTGMYVEASLTLPVPHRTFELPATAVSTGANGVRVQVVDGSGLVHFVPVVLDRDLGSTMHVASGLDGTERVLKLASAGLADGTRVEVATK